MSRYVRVSLLVSFLGLSVLGVSPVLAQVPTSTGASTSSTGTGHVDSGQPFQPIDVNLGVPIGGVSKLQTPEESNGAVRVNFLGQYVDLVYRYMVGVVLVVAIVMVVYGGFLYLVGSTSGNVSRGKEIIRDALMGLILVLAAYAILNTINPATVTLPSIDLYNVQGAIVESPPGEDYGLVGSESCGRHEASDTVYDALFQQYAPCAGLDWRILKAIAYRESGFRACITNRYGFVGLFQVAERTCQLRDYGRSGDCQNLTNPEINTAAAAVGQLRDGANILHDLCPGLTDPSRYVMLLYFSHNSGPGALRSVVNAVGCNASNDAYDQAASQFWEDYSARRHRSLPPNYDNRMPYSRQVAALAVSYGLTAPLAPGGTCPVTAR